jgi:tRNA dimethylallyltransferase
MATTSQKPELLVIVGPTASGKSDLALKIAEEYNGEIIAADSRTIYKGMDVGTAKPTIKEQGKVPHWGIDWVEGIRTRLEQMTTEQLQDYIKTQKYPLPENKNNRRHLVRTIEREGKTGSKRSLKDNIVIIGLLPPADVLKSRIYERAESYFANGLLQETKNLLDKYNEESIGKTNGIAYLASMKLLKKEITKDKALELVKRQEWQYARRQRTWFKRNKFIHWFESTDQAYKEIVRILNN